MSAPTGSAPLPHRTVANIRSPPGAGHHQSGPSTPIRHIPSNFGSPSSLRADEEILIIEIGTRKLQVGFSGDPAPRGCVWFCPDQQRRVGDFRDWQTDYRYDWRSAAAGGLWGRDHELWQYDVRGVNLGLVGDKIERALGEAFTKYLLIDSRPRRMVWVLPSALPIPVLSAALDSVFSRFQSPTISLLSSPLALAVGAGVRSALVIDLGWSETVVTSVYEYREVDSKRSIRGGRMLVEHTHKLLAKNLPETQGGPDGKDKYVVSFEECSDITTRMVWCKPRPRSASGQPSSDALATVQEQDEGELEDRPVSRRTGSVTVPIRSWLSPTSLELPFDALAEPCEDAFFESQYSPTSFDDHELPLHLLVYRSLLQLPVDVRALCMSRIIFTGGCSNVLGLRGRIFDEVSHLIQERGWDPVRGKGVDQLRCNPKLRKRDARQAGDGPTGVMSPPGEGEEQDGVWHDAANMIPEIDFIDEQLQRATDRRPRVQGTLRPIESLGAWSGASLVTHLKALAIATIDREGWLQHGAAGASKPSDADYKTQRQSLGPGGLMRGSAAGSAWTLGVWGAT
ncbi:actin-like ATPase domain-containing protein [Parathielavia appendiculata]|uniref:Actin-like ATPase domain-containing protein n=1 Tax=Parathielavia appendiculata TaxID=2587402 RepID=A0AAN6Z240_9PEZI|nr:actin-like ATPase domain-containing protein [Parathielavia appendiculata]